MNIHPFPVLPTLLLYKRNGITASGTLDICEKEGNSDFLPRFKASSCTTEEENIHVVLSGVWIEGEKI